MAKGAARPQPENDLVDFVGRDVNPVGDLARLGIAPEMARHRGIRDMGCL